MTTVPEMQIVNGGREQVLYQSGRTRVCRKYVSSGARSIVCKELLGPTAAGKLRHERRILERLEGLEGVSRLAAVASEDVPVNGLALEDIKGVSLARAMQREPLEPSELLKLALRLARILTGIHRRGVVHKDINPSNILISETERAPVLIDFDHATTCAEEQPDFVHQNEIVGTLAYLSPEQTGRTGRLIDHRTDLYSLGATLYELAVGQPPFGDADPLQLLHDHLARVPVPPVEQNPCVPRGLSDVILRLLEKEPDRRYQSAEGLEYDLSLLLMQLEQGKEERFLLGERDFPLRLSPPSRLIGREREIGTLSAALESALHSRGRSVLVAGAPGVGKTALINELRSIVTARDGWFVAGKFDQYRQDMASDAVWQALRALGRLLLAEPEAEVAALRERILRTLGPNAGLVAALLPEFALLLRMEPEVMARDAFSEVRLAQSGLDLLRAIASPTRPVVMVIDDLQWGSSTPISFIDAILMDADLRGLLLVSAYREAEVDAAHPLSGNLARWERLGAAPLLLRLHNLPPTDLGALLEEMLRLNPEAALLLAEAVGERTGGNPYDTVELLNALRRDGVLVPERDGWEWNAEAVRRYVGEGEVLDLLIARINRLPSDAQSLLGSMACLGGEVELDVLRSASDLSAATLEEHLAPSLEDGLLVMEKRGSAVRFRHDRVQQAAYSHMGPEQRRGLHLTLARRLAVLPELAMSAAEQYLLASGPETGMDAIEDSDERRRIIGLFRSAAGRAELLANYALAERFLTAALSLLDSMPDATDGPLFTALQTERHAALYGLGRLEEADEVYRSIEIRCSEPLGRADAACVQVSSLTNRNRPSEALAQGLELLQQLGMSVPRLEEMGTEIERGLDTLYRWISESAADGDLLRPEVREPCVVAIARLINRMMPPAFFIDQAVFAWLVIKAQYLWARYGYCAALVGPLAHTGFVTSAIRRDYRTGYNTVRRVLAVGEAHGYEPETSQARFLSALGSDLWFEPLEDTVFQARRAYEGLLQGGDLQNACFTYYASVPPLLDCSPTLAGYAAEVEAGLACAARTSNDQVTMSLLIYRQLVRALRGETDMPGGFTDASFDEANYLIELERNPTAAANFHIHRALAAVLFRDVPGMMQHTARAMPLLPYIQATYGTAVTRLLRAHALAEQIRTAATEDSDVLLAEIDACRDWLACRAVDAPENFLHLVRLIEAERAWAINDVKAAAIAFDAAQSEAEKRQRPWHRAFIAERSGLFYLSQEVERIGRALLVEARDGYEAWGAIAKVHAMEREHPFLGVPARGAQPGYKEDQRCSGVVSSDTIDLLAILRTSQALSSETNLDLLQARVCELLREMTGATRIHIVLWRDDLQGWFLSSKEEGKDTGKEDAEILLSVEAAGASGLLPLSLFRYVERTREPLLVDDATRDDRFLRDPYIAGLDQCSSLVVPILNQGAPCAVLLLENRLGRGAFSTARLDAIMLIAGQLAVSLDNASLYASLERKVSDRTEKLANSLSLLSATLDSTADGILAVQRSGEVSCYNAKFAALWNIPAEMLERRNAMELANFVAAQVRDPEQFLRRVAEVHDRMETEAFDVIELKDGRTFERYIQPQRIEGGSVGVVINFRDVTERKRAEGEIQRIHRQLIEISRQAGMAEVATSVLHNVGNVLNSVNISCSLIASTVRKSRLSIVARTAQLLQERSSAGVDGLVAFLREDPAGQKLPDFLGKLAERLGEEQTIVLNELEALGRNVDHIKEIVSMQQNYANTGVLGGLRETVSLSDLVEDALRINAEGLNRHRMKVVREFEPVPPMPVEKHKVLQILVNLVRNAKHALTEGGREDKCLTLRIARTPTGDCVKVSVRDNGVGIPAENLTRIFALGFTTKKNGHGFGLHSGAIAAREMGASLSVQSDGIGKGATFTLELPLELGTDRAKP